MASIPYTMHSAVNLHKKLTEEQTKNVGVIFEPPTSTVETTLPKYNPKLMNSIWGLYNRYAPHSFQKNCEIPCCSVPGIAGAKDKYEALHRYVYKCFMNVLHSTHNYFWRYTKEYPFK